LPASDLAVLARETGIGWVGEEREPRVALSVARARALELGGVVLVAGSHYLLDYAEPGELAS
jgi:hypothetical protein